MNEEITAFQFDKALAEASDATDDKTAREIARDLWSCYDDLIDHKIVASKETWDYFNRLLLLLGSDGEMETLKSRTKWHPRQGAATLLLLTFWIIAVRVGFGPHLFAYALPFGPPSMFIAWLGSRRREKELRSIEIALTPFPSVSSLLTVRRRVSGFVRRRYPVEIAGRRIRSPIDEKLMLAPWFVLWCVFSPVVLFLQMMPDPDSQTRIGMPEQTAGA